MTVISAESLTVQTADGVPLVRDVSLSIDRGETVVICGPPGSGKTLLAKALHGVLGDRTDLSITGTVERPGSIGFVLQRPRTQLIRQTVYRDLAFGLESTGVGIPEIHERIRREAEALEATDLLDRDIAALSGGEATIVALLGVLVMDPEIVILDEPLSPLDHPNTTLVVETLDRLGASGTTVVLIEHDARTILSRCDRAILLEDGSVSRMGPPDELLSSLYAAGVKLPVHIEVVIESGTGVQTSDLSLAPRSPE